MTDRLSVARLVIEGERFEVLVKPDPALEYKMGKRSDISSILASDEIYTDVNKGNRASKDKLEKYFRTSNTLDVARIILEKGELNLTSEQRRRLIEEKRRQIVTIITRSYVDPKTHLPHPPLRIEQAMEECKVAIDPFKKAEDQVKSVVDALRSILPMKSERLKFTLIVPAQYAAQSYSVIKGMGEILKEEWQADGSLKVIIEIPAAIQANMMDRLASITKGTAQAVMMR
ncbi:MAG: ribosome assembly factor SBDS [Candidatus Nitrosocaldus sp.]|nr:ribosome assembly factor SBDS [Candidatus Nitrosocaldus sp.]MDW8000881.1 ribosome assembly factor SBDS [Candidatus Nitrosocaldus sp.]